MKISNIDVDHSQSHEIHPEPVPPTGTPTLPSALALSPPTAHPERMPVTESAMGRRLRQDLQRRRAAPQAAGMQDDRQPGRTRSAFTTQIRTNPDFARRVASERWYLDPPGETLLDTWHALSDDLRWSGRFGRQAQPVMPPSDISAERAMLTAALADIPWSRRVAPGQPYHDRQRLLEARFADWAEDIVRARRKAFGPAYVLGQDMRAQMLEAMLPAFYQGLRQAISSAARSPLRNALVTWLGPRRNKTGQNVGELNNGLDPAVIGGVSGGLAAYLTDAWILQPMDRRAKLSNLPAIKAVDVKILAPEPGPVRLRMVEGCKEYWCPVSDEVDGHADVSDPADPSLPQPGEPTSTALENSAIALRESLLRWQGNLDGKGLMAWFRPGVSGAFNTLRRAISTAQSLAQPLPVFGSSMLASSSAGGAAKFAIDMAKATPWMSQVRVDDLIGASQTVNLFAVKAPNAEVRPAQWRDIKGLPGFASLCVWESYSLVKRFFDPGRSPREILGQGQDMLRIMIAGSTASVVSAATGQKLAEIKRAGSPAALPGESSRSGANLLQQFGQSAMNDYMWDAAKDYTKNDAYDLGLSLDGARDSEQERLLEQARQAQRRLPELVAGWRAQMPPTVDVDGLSHAIESIPVLNMSMARINELLAELQAAAAALPAMNSAQLLVHARLVEGLNQVVKPIATRDALVRKRAPVTD